MSRAAPRPDGNFAFRFSPAYRVAALPFGILPATANAQVAGAELRIRFGPWRVSSPLTNISSISLTGPYRRLFTAGPARLSLADRGLTFATNPDLGLCIRFVVPVAGIEPFGFLRHPGVTVTVAQPHELAALLSESIPGLELPTGRSGPA